MLHLEDIHKTYQTGSFKQAALDGVTITFRDNEFVAVLGPSGSGKTTLLNIVGGLDHYDSGDLVIDQVSTNEYRDRDWDTYRNNRIGFVFQSYNLIPHQTVLANVELALTLTGVGPAERSARAKAVLDQVGLIEHIHKLPSQLSGGQMQRVAIARALVNDPEILLADEPTGALDSKTSVQVMDLLKGIAKDRLVILVTHNSELANRYANRIVSLRDGVVTDDTRPFSAIEEVREAKPVRRTSMSFFTAIALSFTNLMTKKGRTFMTSLAGSIGIAGIATILALSNGLNVYIRSVEENTLSEYPLSIQTQGFDLTSMMVNSTQPDEDLGDSKADAHEVKLMTRMLSGIGSNDLKALKTFLDSPDSGLDADVRAIQYNYAITPQIYAADTSKTVRQINPNTMLSAFGIDSNATSNSMMSTMGMSSSVFQSLPDDLSLLTSQYDVLAGAWPTKSDECVVVITPWGGISDIVLYSIGLRDPAELEKMMQDLSNGDKITIPIDTLEVSYQQLMDVSFKVVNPTSLYEYDSAYSVWSDRHKDEVWMKRIVNAGQDLRIVGVVAASQSATSTMLRPGLYYTGELTRQLMDQAAKAPIVIQQLASPDVNVLSGKTFAEEATTPALSDFDFFSLLDIDQDAMAEMFASGFDLSSMSFDLPNMNTGSISNVDLSKMPALDLPTMLGQADLEIDSDAMVDAISYMLALYLHDVFGVDTLLPGGSSSDPTASPSTGLPSPTTGLPTSLPTGLPTSLPTGLPTGLPTSLPTTLPTSLPTGLPTGLPTDQPTDSPTGIPDLSDPESIIESFSQWFAQPQIQAQLTARLMGAVMTDANQKKLSYAVGKYFQKAMESALKQVMASIQTNLAVAMQATMNQLTDQMSSAMNFKPEDFEKFVHFNSDPEQLAAMMMTLMNSQANTLDYNLRLLGYANPDTPSSIDIYPNDFTAKQKVLDALNAYNDRMTASGQDDKVITFTDIVGTLMNSVTDIVDKISAVLVAFVSISLVVSSIMIGVITYISVLERKKEIGILRAIGASKRDIGNVFNAETLIVGFMAGLIGILITLLLITIANPILYTLIDVDRIARLPLTAALALIGVSMVLTFLAGLIPSSAASRKDPVEALRSE